MRNLRVLEQHFLARDGPWPPSACAWDVTDSSVLYTKGPTQDSHTTHLARWRINGAGTPENHESTIATWESPPPNPELAYDSIIDVHFLSDTRIACLVFVGGDIVIVREDPALDEEKVEIVGSVDAGLVAAAWSPDKELLALISKADTLVLMSRDFEGLSNTSFSNEDLSASKHVSVGWGKAETQFKGKGSKALRDPTIPEKVDQGLTWYEDDHTTVISWRGDGAFLAINSLQASDRRSIRIYTRDGELDGVSEPVDFLEGSLNWRPAGNILASTRHLDGRIEVVFFERNGLRHGDFRLRTSVPEDDAFKSPIALAWNCDSSILAVGIAGRIQFWTMGNYHYYLKQEILLDDKTGSPPSRILWHPEDPLLCTTSTPGIEVFRW